VGNIPRFANWVQVEMGKILQNIQVDHKNFHFLNLNFSFKKLCVVKTCSKFGS